MNFAFSEEQEELRRSVRRFLEDKSPMTEVRRLMETTEGFDPAVWDQMANQLGLQALAIPEEYGGAGFGYVELTVVLEETGGGAAVRALLLDRRPRRRTPCWPRGDEGAKKDLLPGIASGETIATLALTEDTGRWDLDGITLAAAESGGGWALDGHKMFVIDGHVADLVLVAGPHRHGV